MYLVLCKLEQNMDALVQYSKYVFPKNFGLAYFHEQREAINSF